MTSLLKSHTSPRRKSPVKNSNYVRRKSDKRMFES